MPIVDGLETMLRIRANGTGPAIELMSAAVPRERERADMALLMQTI
jgi:CheY-like chemotaxis protein